MSKTIKIAIAGEGPIGLITLAKLIISHQRNKDENKKKLEITLYTKYDSYSRRHVLFLSNAIVDKLENEILNAPNSLRFDKSGDIQVSTRLLENILFNNIKQKADVCETSESNFCIIKILTKQQFTINDYDKYDHVFLATGFQADIRKKIMNSDNNYLPLLAKSQDTILVLYTGIAPVSSKNYLEDIGSKFEFIDKDIVESFQLDTNLLTSFITTIYKYNKFINSFNPKDKPKPVDLWVSGFSSYDNFVLIFEQTINDMKLFLSSNDIDSVIKIYTDNKSAPTDLDMLILKSLRDNSDLHKELWIKYSQMVQKLLEDRNCLDKLFMLHSVNLSTKCNGCYLDTYNIEFCKMIGEDKKSFIWLIGDTAIAYEATYSLELNLTYVNYIIPKFYNFFVQNNHMKFTNKNARDALRKLKLSDDLKSFKLSGGYLDSETILNYNLKQVQDIIDNIIINYDRNNIDDGNSYRNFMRYYNLTYFIYFIKNLGKIMLKKIHIYKFRKTYKKFHILKYIDKTSSVKTSSKQSRSKISVVSSYKEK